MVAGDRRDENVDIEEQADAVADFVEELLAKMDIDAIAEPTEQVVACTSTSWTATRRTCPC